MNDVSLVAVLEALGHMLNDKPLVLPSELGRIRVVQDILQGPPFLKVLMREYKIGRIGIRGKEISGSDYAWMRTYQS